MSQRVLVTGATGLLGRQVLKAFESSGWDIVGTGFSRAKPPQIRKIDIQNAEEVTALLDEVKPQVVVHCAADRQPDSCTANPDGARSLNVTATLNLAAATAQRGIFLIYISTDYVFSGKQGEAPYNSTSTPAPTNIYGQTKLDGENAILETSSDTSSNKGVPSSVVLRVPVLYGETSPTDNNKESAVNVLMDALWKSQKESVKMDDWAIRYPTNTADVGRVCADIATLYTSTSPEKSLPIILAFSSEDRMTKYEICLKLGELMGLPTDGIIPDKDGGKPGPDGTLRPYDCHLSTEELKNIGIEVRTMDFVAWWRRYVGAYRR